MRLLSLGNDDMGLPQVELWSQDRQQLFWLSATLLVLDTWSQGELLHLLPQRELRSSTRAPIGKHNAVAYMHVDDGVFFGAKAMSPSSETLMHNSADALQEIGFVVTDRQPPKAQQKLLGFELLQKTATMQLTGSRLSLLTDTLLWLASHHEIDTVLLRTTIGIWVWAVSLCREQLCVASAVFRLIQDYLPKIVPLWPSVRRELRVMASLTPALIFTLYRKTPEIVFATDAEGCNSDDFGGFGVVGKFVDSDIIKAIVFAGDRPGMTVAKMDGSINHMFRVDKEVSARIPITRLPRTLLDPNKYWKVISRGRWENNDHITLGDGRGANVLVQRLGAIPNAHGGRFVSLNDILPWTGCTAKGRSPAFRISSLLRKRAAIVIAADLQVLHPWVDTLHMPADEASRRH